MKPKTLPRSNRLPLIVTAEQWHAITTAREALEAGLAPALQPLTASERQDLLGVGSARESFTRDFMALLELHPESLPAALRPTETLRDWKTRETLAAQRWAVAELLQKIDDTMAGLAGDCLATALAGYQLMVRGGAPAGTEAIVEQLRSHFARRSPPTAEAGTTPKPAAAAAPTALPAADTTPRNETSHVALAA